MAPPSSSGPSSWSTATLSTPIFSTKRKHDTVMINDSSSKRPRLGSWLSSKPFIFVVGSEKKEYYLHKELLAKVSEPLRALIYGGMKESIEGKVEWPDVDEETFVRFSEFVYDGEYTDAGAFIAKTGAATNPAPVADPSPSLGKCARNRGLGIESLFKYLEANLAKHSLYTVQSFKLRAICRFLDNCYGNHAFTDKFTEASTQAHGRSTLWQPSSCREQGECFKPVFECHFKLYILADKYIIPGLMAMAHNRLLRTLLELRLDHEGVLLDLVGLVDMVWPWTSCKPIRTMLVCYLACITEKLPKSSEFRDLCKRLPDFAISLLDKTSPRLEVPNTS